MIKATNKKSGNARRSSAAAKKQHLSKHSVPDKDASARSRASKREVTFAVYEPEAEQVFLSGAFNDWQSTPLTRQANRDWKTTVSLAPGHYEYKFVVDGKWKIDPRAHRFASNEFGTLNSLIEVKP